MKNKKVREKNIPQENVKKLVEKLPEKTQKYNLTHYDLDGRTIRAVVADALKADLRDYMLRTLYGYMGRTRAQLAELLKTDDLPTLDVILAGTLLNAAIEGSTERLEPILDRLLGKATQTTHLLQQVSAEHKHHVVIDVSDCTEDQLMQLIGDPKHDALGELGYIPMPTIGGQIVESEAQPTPTMANADTDDNKGLT